MRQQDIRVITPLSRGLPKTGQVVSYNDDDDGYYEAGWWLGRLNENNINRFVEKEFVVGQKVIIDLATKIMWPKDLHSSICNYGNTIKWANAVNFPIGVDYGGFSNWRLPNLFEMSSLLNLNEVSPSFYKTVFTNWAIYDIFWTSSTKPTNTTYASMVTFAFGYYSLDFPKMNTYNFMSCRSV